MKFVLFKLPAIVGMLLPLLLLTRACDCLPGDGASARCPAGSCEMPPLPRLPRG